MSSPQKDYLIKPLIFWRLSSPLSTKELLHSTLCHLGLLDYKMELYLLKRSSRYTHYLKVLTFDENGNILLIEYYGVNIDSYNLKYPNQLLINFFNQVIENA